MLILYRLREVNANLESQGLDELSNEKVFG